MSTFSSRINSYFLINGYQKKKNYPTFMLAMLSIQLLAGIAWWSSKSLIFVLAPFITTFILPHCFIYYFFFLGMSLYCGTLDHNYKNIEQNLLLGPQNGLIHIKEISHKEENKNYCITCSFSPFRSEISSNIKIITPEIPNFLIGDILEIKDLLFSKSASNNYRKYLQKESIHGISYTKHLNYRKVGNITTWYAKAKKYLFYLEGVISKKISSSSSFLFNSLFLGSKKQYRENEHYPIKKYFDIWGICHFLARSGLHVTLILSLVLTINRLAKLPLAYSDGITLTFLLLYMLFSYSSVSFYRAAIVAFYGLWCTRKKVSLNLMHLLLISLISLILYNPFYIFFLDFQLTFLLTFGLCTIYLFDS